MLNLEYLRNLNEQQKDAVSHLNGPLLIVAGAGSGKTRVLTIKLLHLLVKVLQQIIKIKKYLSYYGYYFYQLYLQYCL